MKNKWIKDGEFYQEGSSIIIKGQRHFAPLTEEQMKAAGYVEWIPYSPEPAPESEIDPQLLLEDTRNRKLMEIESYDISSAVNSFTINNLKMWLTVNERQLLSTQINANEAIGRKTMTKWFNDVEFTFSIADWKQMLIALEVYAGDALNVTKAHKVAVKALDNVEDIENFDITADYPEKLVFN